MKITIHIPELVEAAKIICRCFETRKFVAGVGNNSNTVKQTDVPRRTRRIYDGERGCSWVYRNYGYTQAQTTKVAKLKGIKNHGTANNPRYTLKDIQLIVAELDKQQKKQ